MHRPHAAAVMHVLNTSSASACAPECRSQSGIGVHMRNLGV